MDGSANVDASDGIGLGSSGSCRECHCQWLILLLALGEEIFPFSTLRTQLVAETVTCACRQVRGMQSRSLIETPLPSNDLTGYARVAAEQSIPLAAGEWFATRLEFLDLIDSGKIRVVQPDVGRVGGLMEAKSVCTLAEQRQLTIVPHLWKTWISVAAAAHLAATAASCAFIEYLPQGMCESALGRDLVSDEFRMVDGVSSLPNRPGLGSELNRDALDRFKEKAEIAAPTLRHC